MAKIEYLNADMVAWVTDDGSYGVGPVVVFDPDMLTDEQWEVLSSLNDNDRIEYTLAVLNGEDISEFEDKLNG